MILADEIFFTYYQYFYSRFYGNKKYKMNKKLLPKYSKKLDALRKDISQFYNLEVLSNDWLFKYFTFTFERLSKLPIYRMGGDLGEGRIIFDDITRHKSLELFLNRNIYFDDSQQYLNFWKQYDIKKYELINLIASRNVDEIISKKIRLQDIERNRFLNTDDGFQHCMDQVLLYDEESNVCKLCTFKKICK